MQQRRLLLALILSSAILFAWTYFYPVQPPKNQQPGASPAPSATVTPAGSQPIASSSPAAAPSAPAPNVSEAPQRTITITTPLYETKFDTRGAEPVSWIIKTNKSSKTEIYSVAGSKRDKKPLELISPEGLKRQPRQVPFQLQTGDATLDALLASTSYRVEGVDNASGDINLDLAAGQKKELTFVFEDANRVQVRKSIFFDGDRYETDLAVM